MKLSILKRTTEYRGDHSTDLLLAYDLRPGESVENLVARLRLQPNEVIEVRVMEEPQR